MHSLPDDHLLPLSQIVVGELFEKQSYGIGVPQGSAYRKDITRAILALREQGFFDELENRYFGTGTAGASAVAAR